ncbi:T5orf172 domain-containing protein [Aspergillus ambiguus]|uniref:GIY-YIG nuclease family protein n=1 Tax=Aspergillus ambiguus TaxID=176160 RepID=UPI003CCD12A9
MQCQAITKKDRQCKNYTGAGSRLCSRHQKLNDVALANEEASTNDSPTEIDHSSDVGGLISGIESMGLENDSPGMMKDTGRENRHIEGGKLNAALLYDDGDTQLEIRLRRTSQERVSLEPGSATCVMKATSPSTRRPKLRLSAVNIPDPHKAFCETPRAEIPPGIDRSLHWALGQIMVRPASEKHGIIYICKVTFETQRSQEKEVIKIGNTSNITTRLATHSRGCYPGTRSHLIATYPRPKPKPGSPGRIRNCYQVEALIRKTLERFSYDMLCACGTKHKELFEICPDELDEVLKHVESWVSWSEENYGLV